jgi:serine/threonine protein kinase
MVPRAKTQMNLAGLVPQKSTRPLVRSKTYPDPLMSSGYKFSVADPFRRDRQIQTLGENVDIEQFYDLGSLIGAGGFGAVKESTNASTLQTYAVKVVQKSSLAADHGNADKAAQFNKGNVAHTEKTTELNDTNFRDIVELLMNQRHRYTVTIERVFENKMNYYVVMHKCNGGDLRKHINSLTDEKQHFEEEKLREIVQMLGDALRCLHNMARVHRDVKPENVLYETEARDTVKLADFDMCCRCEESQDYVVGSSIVGTLGYLAPEVLSLNRYSRQSDLFAFGVLMHYCATLTAPKELVSPRDVTSWCEAAQQKLAEGTGACEGRSPLLRQAIGSLLSPSAHLRPAHFDMFLECPWLCNLTKKRTPRRRSKPDSIQRLLQVDEMQEVAAPVA